jgi:hypothetical protein
MNLSDWTKVLSDVFVHVACGARRSLHTAAIERRTTASNDPSWQGA